MKRLAKLLSAVMAVLALTCTAAMAEYSEDDLIYEGFENDLGMFSWPDVNYEFVSNGATGSALMMKDVHTYKSIRYTTVLGINRYYRISYWVKGAENYTGKQLVFVIGRTHSNSLGETSTKPAANYTYIKGGELTGEWKKVTQLICTSSSGMTDETGICKVYPVLYYTNGIGDSYKLPQDDAASYCIDEFKIEPLDIVYNGDFSDGTTGFDFNSVVNAYTAVEGKNNFLVMNCFGDNKDIGYNDMKKYIHIEEGVRYRISYRAKAAVGTNTVQPIFQRASGSLPGEPSIKYQYLTKKNITDEWKVYEEIFTAPSELKEGVAYRYPLLTVRIGNPGTVYIDDLKIEKLGSEVYDIKLSGVAKSGNNVDVSFSDDAAGYRYAWRIMDNTVYNTISEGETDTKSFSFVMPSDSEAELGIKRIYSDGTFGTERRTLIRNNSDETLVYSSDKQEIAAEFSDTVWAPDFDTVRANIAVKNICEALTSYLAVYDEDDRLIHVSSVNCAEGNNSIEAPSSNGCVAKLFVWNSNFSPKCKAQKLSKDTGSRFIYIDKEHGKVTNTGTYDKPVKTINDALGILNADKASGNVYVMIKSGSYMQSEPIQITSDKYKSSANVVFASYGGKSGERAVISGGKTISGWSIYDSGKNIYRAPVTGVSNFRQLYVNGNRAQRARSYFAPKLISLDDTGYVLADTTMLKYSNIEDAEFVYYYKWTNPRCGIESVSDNGDGTVTVDMDDYCYNLLRNKAHLEPVNGPAYLENLYELLDAPGEWYFDRNEGYVYYMPRSFEDMNTAAVTVPTTELLLNIEGNSSTKIQNITFKNIEFAYSTWLYPDTYGYSDAQSGRIRDGKDNIPGAAVTVSYAKNVNFEECKFSNLGMTGLTMMWGIEDCNVIGNEFSNLAGTGMYIGTPYQPAVACSNIKIKNNYIHDIGQDYKSSVGIATLWLSGTDLEHNEIFDVPYTAVHGGYGASTSIVNLNYNYNYIHRNLNDEIYDGGALYSTGNTGGTSENPNYMKGNYLKEQLNSHGALYPDNSSTGWYLCDNVIDLSMVSQWANGTKPRWLLSNPAERNRADNNYTTTTEYLINKGYLTDKENDPGVTVTNTHCYPDAGWPDEALSIIDNAGLQEYYSAKLSPSYQITKLACDKLSIKAGMTASVPLYGEGGKSGVMQASDEIFIENNSPYLVTVNSDNTITANKTGSGYLTVYTKTKDGLKKLTIEVEVY